ncbi:hypothetical protein BD414DRAFT_326708 [Trametes punicea]|nr:hypothetical protein BD414DRAFT_326708 [Trametes punicea]
MHEGPPKGRDVGCSRIETFHNRHHSLTEVYSISHRSAIRERPAHVSRMRKCCATLLSWSLPCRLQVFKSLRRPRGNGASTLTKMLNRGTTAAGEFRPFMLPTP